MAYVNDRWPSGPLGRASRLILELFWQSVVQFQMDQVGRLAAALSFYAILSIAPLLVVMISVAGFFIGESMARVELVIVLEQLFDASVANAVDRLIDDIGRGSWSATIFGLAVLTFAASNVFAQLKAALNTAWRADVEVGVSATVRSRAMAFALVLVTGGLLVASVLLTTLTDVVVRRFEQVASANVAVPQANELITFLVLVVLIGLIYRLLPDTDIRWRDVWIGAAFTAALFVLGMELISRYLAARALSSVYGAAASVVFGLLWVYYSSMVFMFGAVFTHVFAVRLGSRHAERPTVSHSARHPAPGARVPRDGGVA